MNKKILIAGFFVSVMLLVPINSAYSNIGIQIDDKPIIPMSRSNTLYVGGNGSGNYTKIQDAVDNAVDGDTVFVYDDSSPYYENVVIDKSINFIGENKDTTVIDGKQTGGTDTVGIWASFVLISGFTLQNCGYGDIAGGVGIRVGENNIIFNNKIIGNPTGIYCFRDSSKTIIENNEIGKNSEYDGIMILSSDDNIIINNTISDSLRYGIRIANALNNTILCNNISNFSTSINCDYDCSNTNIIGNFIESCSRAISLYHSYNLNISDNHLLNNNAGICMYSDYYFDKCKNITISGNIIKNCKYYGICLEGFYLNVFKNNITDNDIGIEFFSDDNNIKIYQNNIMRNNKGIDIGGTVTNNQIYQNNIMYNWIGLYINPFPSLEGIKNNYFYQNNFIGNHFYNALITGLTRKNYWDFNGFGNYWDDYKGKDSDDDGIGDTPYIVKQSLFGDNIDNYPLMKPYGNVTNFNIKNQGNLCYSNPILNLLLQGLTFV